VQDLYVGYFVAGTLSLLLVLFSERVERWPVSGPLLGLLAGVAVGPVGLRLLEVPDVVRDPLLREGARALLAVSLIGVALRFPVRTLRPVLRPVTLLILVVMPLSAAAAGTLSWLTLGLPVGLGFLLGACLSPTDPVLASGVVSGDLAQDALPERLRAVLTEESGANDGLALPLVLLALPLVVTATLGEMAVTSVYQVLAGAAAGAAVGAGTGWLLRFVEARGDISTTSRMVVTLTMAVAVLGLARLVDSDGVLAVFVAGLACNAVVGRREREQQEALDDVANRYLTVPFFLLLGVVLPWSQWADLGAGALLFAPGVLLVRRPPAVLLLARVLGLRWKDAAFVGWFGPMGVSAVFYLLLSAEEGAGDPRLFAAGMLAVAVSTVAHGVTAVPARSLYARGG